MKNSKDKKEIRYIPIDASSLVKPRAKHTPGPWKIFADGSGPGYILEPVKNMPVCRISMDKTAIMNANARLIASSPELLSALKAANDYLIAVHAPPSLLMACGKAIAKAEGRKDD